MKYKLRRSISNLCQIHEIDVYWMYCDKSARKWQITPIKENAKEENEEKSGSGTFSNLKLLQNEQKLREPLFQGEASEAWLEKSFYFLQKMTKMPRSISSAAGARSTLQTCKSSYSPSPISSISSISSISWYPVFQDRRRGWNQAQFFRLKD